ncbi:transposase [Paenibacillus larvae]|nr:transposase [Paenibacillus larvae]
MGSNCWPRLTMKRDIVWQEDEQYTAETFLSFLQKVMATYPTGKLALVLDNARIHHAKLLRPFLEAQKIGLSLCTCLHTALS